MSKSHRNVPAHPPQSSFIAPPYLPSLGAGMMSRGVWCVTWVSPWQVLREHHGPSLLSLSEKMLLGPRLWGTDLRGFLLFPSGQQSWPPPKNILWTFPSQCRHCSSGYRGVGKATQIVTLHNISSWLEEPADPTPAHPSLSLCYRPQDFVNCPVVANLSVSCQNINNLAPLIFKMDISTAKK